MKVLDSACSNEIASKLGRVAGEAGDLKRKDIGDSIDRGLVLLRLLREKGFAVCVALQKGDDDAES